MDARKTDYDPQRVETRKERFVFRPFNVIIMTCTNSDTRPLDARNIEHDYAVIELAKDAGVDYMRFTISPDLTQFNGRIHFR